MTGSESSSLTITPGYQVGFLENSIKHPIYGTTIYFRYDNNEHGIASYFESGEIMGFVTVCRGKFFWVDFNWTDNSQSQRGTIRDLTTFTYEDRVGKMHRFTIFQREVFLYVELGIFIPLDEDVKMLHEYGII